MRLRSTAETGGSSEMLPLTDQRQEAFYPDLFLLKATLQEIHELLLRPGRVGSSVLIVSLTHLNEVNWLDTWSSSSTSSLMWTGLGLPDVSRVTLASLHTAVAVYLKGCSLARVPRFL